MPGIDAAALAAWFEQQSGGILGMFNMFSGGALSRFGIFALGIVPYISASNIMQMASHIVPSLQQLRKEGEQGRRQIVNRITSYNVCYTKLLRSRQGATREHVEHAQDAALLRIEQIGQNVGIDTRSYNFV